MKTKPRIVSPRVGSLNANWLALLVEDYFDLSINPHELKSGDLYCAHDWDETAIQWNEAGEKVVIDRLWETPNTKLIKDPGYEMTCPNWFWYNESLWYRYLGYDTYKPQPDWKYRALMPMRMEKPHRDYLLKTITPWLDKILWSYQATGRHLPGDLDAENWDIVWDSQRYFNPAWYNETAFSIISESTVFEIEPGHPPFITEKTFKPIAFYHPFVVQGQVGTLAYLRKLGFETFDNLFDESYDLEPNRYKRTTMAVLAAMNAQLFDNIDSLTQQKLAHNHARFFDQKLASQRIVTEVLEPLLNYAEA